MALISAHSQSATIHANEDDLAKQLQLLTMGAMEVSRISVALRW